MNIASRFEEIRPLQAARYWMRHKSSAQLRAMRFAGKYAREAELIATAILIRREDGWEKEP